MSDYCKNNDVGIYIEFWYNCDIITQKSIRSKNYEKNFSQV